MRNELSPVIDNNYICEARKQCDYCIGNVKKSKRINYANKPIINIYSMVSSLAK